MCIRPPLPPTYPLPPCVLFPHRRPCAGSHWRGDEEGLSSLKYYGTCFFLTRRLCCTRSQILQIYVLSFLSACKARLYLIPRIQFSLFTCHWQHAYFRITLCSRSSSNCPCVRGCPSHPTHTSLLRFIKVINLRDEQRTRTQIEDLETQIAMSDKAEGSRRGRVTRRDVLLNSPVI